MRSQARPSQEARPQGEYALRLTRVGAGATITVRCLSAVIDGLLVHYVGKPQRSQYCPGLDGCRHHKERVQWRGYLAVEQWDQVSGLYFPTVLEVTEFAEVEMRSRYRRGQIWNFSRQLDVNDVAQPVVPVLVSESVSGELQPAFNVLPVLVNVYHVFNVALGVRNPMPARVIVRPIAAEPPPGMAKASGEFVPPSPEEMAKFRSKIRTLGKMPGEKDA